MRRVQVQPVTFRILLYRHRVAAGLTQQALAERAGVSARAISDLERGVKMHPRPYTVHQLATALELGPEERGRFEYASRSPADEIDTRGAACGELPTGNFLGALPQTPLVGREREVARLRAAAARVLAGVGQCVVLTGEPGIGKTRLAQQIVLDLWEQGVAVGPARCYEGCELTAYYPLLEAFPALFASATSALQSQAARRWPQLGTLLSLHARAPAPALTACTGEHQSLQRAVLGFVQMLAVETPVALVVDDLRWADSASLDLVLQLARYTRGARVLLIAAYRPIPTHGQEGQRRVLRELNREGLLERLALSALDEEETRKLIALILPDALVPANFGSLVHRWTDGNPFFIKEVTRSLLERGAVRREGGQWMLHEGADIILPESIREAIAEQVGQLSNREQELLRAASVLGRSFTVDDLAAIVDADADGVEEGLEAALAMGLLRQAAESTYAFHHAFIQRALYSQLPGRRQRELHRAVREGRLAGQ